MTVPSGDDVVGSDVISRRGVTFSTVSVRLTVTLPPSLSVTVSVTR